MSRPGVVLPAGARLTKGAALFPRLDTEDGVVVEVSGDADAAR